MTLLCIALCTYVTLQIRLKLREQEEGKSPPSEAGLVLPEFGESWLPGLNPHVRRKKTQIGGNESRLFAADLDKLSD